MRKAIDFCLPVSCLVSVFEGFLLITLPSILQERYRNSIFDLVNSSVKDMSLVTLLPLLIGGIFWGIVLRWPRSLPPAACQVGSLPVLALIEIAKDPTSHNLWPFEFSIYAALAVVSMIGAAAAAFVKKQLKRVQTDHSGS